MSRFVYIRQRSRRAAITLYFLSGDGSSARPNVKQLPGTCWIMLPMNPFRPRKFLKMPPLAKCDKLHLRQLDYYSFLAAKTTIPLFRLRQRQRLHAVASYANVPLRETQHRNRHIDVRHVHAASRLAVSRRRPKVADIKKLLQPRFGNNVFAFVNRWVCVARFVLKPGIQSGNNKRYAALADNH